MFVLCTSLASVTLPASVTSIMDGAFGNCYSLTNVTIPSGVTNIGNIAFVVCSSLTNVAIPASVTRIGNSAFSYCVNLARVYFEASPPSLGSDVFSGDAQATVYYLPAATGWSPQVQTSDGTFGVRSNEFGFTITGTSGLATVVQACADLAHPVWEAVGTNTLSAGVSYFSDPQWTNYPTRFYRLSGLTFAGLPAVLWNPQPQSPAVQANQLGFTIAGTPNIPIAVEACANLPSGCWTSLQTCTLTNGSIYFSDPDWTNHPTRFYRIRSP